MEKDLDICKQNDDHFSFYQNLINNIWKSKLLQFGYINDINMYICHSYLKILKDFILMEKAIITCTYLIISIIKLRLSGVNVSTFYSKIYRYAVDLP